MYFECVMNSNITDPRGPCYNIRCANGGVCIVDPREELGCRFDNDLFLSIQFYPPKYLRIYFEHSYYAF